MSKKPRRVKKKSSISTRIRMREAVKMLAQETSAALHKRIQDEAVKITGEMADKGTAIEDGFNAFMKHFMPNHTDTAHRTMLRTVWLMSADFLYSQMLGSLSAGDEVSPIDEDRMRKLHNELAAFRAEKMTFHSAPESKQ